MLTYKEYLSESVINVFKDTDKDRYAEEIYDLLQSSYSRLGGLKGSGFKSIEDMKKNIKMWKVVREDGTIKALLLYKDKNNMRKTIAVATDGTKKGKEKLQEMLIADFERSNIEVSHSLMKFIEKTMPKLVKKYAVPTDKVSDILRKPITILDEFHYERVIGDTMITKMMLGNIKQFY